MDRPRLVCLNDSTFLTEKREEQESCSPRMGRLTKTVLILAGVVVVSVGLLQSHVLSSKLNVTWSYDYTRLPACGGSRVQNCVDHFEILDITNPSKTKMLRRVENPEHASSRVDHVGDAFPYGPPFGERTISVIAVGRDEHGERTESNPFAARQAVNVRPLSATHLKLN